MSIFITPVRLSTPFPELSEFPEMWKVWKNEHGYLVYQEELYSPRLIVATKENWEVYTDPHDTTSPRMAKGYEYQEFTEATILAIAEERGLDGVGFFSIPGNPPRVVLLHEIQGP